MEKPPYLMRHGGEPLTDHSLLCGRGGVPVGAVIGTWFAGLARNRGKIGRDIRGVFQFERHFGFRSVTELF